VPDSDHTADPLACVPAIDGALEAYTRSLDLPPNLCEAVRYALLGGGKRLRPVLCWHACAAVGGKPEASLSAGAAIELIHAFSLVHDDLPAMDDDDLRRGRPTLHIHAGEAMAILAGDAMMALAFELVVEGGHSPALGVALVRELSAATTGMIAGQVYDTLGGFAEALPPRERLALIHRNKTGALIRAACRMGALSGGADPASAVMLAITRYAEAVGLMFQIVDDILDVETTPEQSGKRTRKDADAGKLTYPGLLGLEGSREEVLRLSNQAIDSIGALGPAAEPLRMLCRRMAVRRS
jgi:geranylgeranyl diphosphate synthase type II